MDMAAPPDYTEPEFRFVLLHAYCRRMTVLHRLPRATRLLPLLPLLLLTLMAFHATPTHAQIAPLLTKSCTPVNPPVGTSTVCRLTITSVIFSGSITDTVTGPGGGMITACNSAGGPFGPACPSSGLPAPCVKVDCASSCSTDSTFDLTITATSAGPLTESVVILGRFGVGGSFPVAAVPPVTFVAAGGLTVLKTASANPATFAQPFSYGVTVQNSGAGAATLVQLSDPLPAGLQVGAVTASQGSCSTASNTVSCALGTIAAGGSATVTITVTPQVTGTLTNTATASSPGVASASGTVVTMVQAAPVTVVTPGGAEPPVTGIPPLTIIGVPAVLNPIFPVVVTPQQPTPQQTAPVVLPAVQAPVQQLSFLINIYPPGNNGQPSSQQLVVGCNQVTISSPAGTAVSAIAARVTPAGAVVSIYRFNNGLQRYQAGFFAMTGAPVDFSSTGGGFESYQVCVNQAATITSG